MAPIKTPRDNKNGILDSEITSIIIIVSVVVISMAIIAFLISWIARRRKPQKYEPAPNPNPYPLKTKEQKAEHRKVPDLGRVEEVELQRQEMIHKSLATRTSRKTLNRLSEANTEEDDGVEADMRRKSLRSEWKEWEANIQRERSISLDRHPGLDRNFSGSCVLPVLEPLGAGSPSRHPFPTRSTTLPTPSKLAKIPDDREL